MGSQLRIAGTPPSPRQAGARRQAVGAAAEAMVKSWHRACVLAGLAEDLTKGNEGWRPVRGGKVLPLALGDVDFRTTLRGGRAMLLEVKSADLLHGPWPLRNLADHQADILERHHRLGALCLVAIVQLRGTSWVVPWEVVQRARIAHAAGGPASLNSDQLAPYIVQPGALYLKRFCEETKR